MFKMFFNCCVSFIPFHFISLLMSALGMVIKKHMNRCFHFILATDPEVVISVRKGFSF